MHRKEGFKDELLQGVGLGKEAMMVQHRAIGVIPDIDAYVENFHSRTCVKNELNITDARRSEILKEFMKSPLERTRPA